jgi:dTDP-4-dehydrorhamnose 3,5-epimerase
MPAGDTNILDLFVQDKPYANSGGPRRSKLPSPIDGVVLETIEIARDNRGSLLELLSQRNGAHDEIVHTYIVKPKPGSVRGWVLHKHQRDRLVYVDGTLDILLYDVRADSPTFGVGQHIKATGDQPLYLEIPEFVAHCVGNFGTEEATFVNLPTKVYDLGNPDKHRLAYPSPHIPFTFPDND